MDERNEDQDLLDEIEGSEDEYDFTKKLDDHTHVFHFFINQRIKNHQGRSILLGRMSSIINDFRILIRNDKIPLETFWSISQAISSIGEFKSFFRNINHFFSPSDIEILISELFKGKQNLTIDRLCSVIDEWKGQESNLIDGIRENALKIANDSKKKLQVNQSQGKSIRPNSSLPTYGKSGRPISNITKVSGEYNNKLYQKELESRPPPPNKSRQYLKESKEKEKKLEQLLQLTIQKSKNEYEYECLIKMGEANELSQSINSKITYRAYKSADGNLKVHVYDLDKFVKELTLDEFIREYNIIKNQYNQKSKKKAWELLAEQKPKADRIKSAVRKEESFGKEEDIKIGNKKERQQELKQVLLETMMLSNVLKEQLGVLNKKGINAGGIGTDTNQNYY